MKALIFPLVMPLIEQAAANVITSNKVPFRGKNKLGLGLLALSGFLLISALIFVILSVYGWLLMLYVQPIAALIAAGGVMFFTLITAVSGISLLKKKPKPVANDVDITKLMETLSEAAGEELMQPIHDNPKTAVALASLAGFVAGDRLN